MKFQVFCILLLFTTVLLAQDDSGDTTLVDSAAVDVIPDSTVLENTVVDSMAATESDSLPVLTDQDEVVEENVAKKPAIAVPDSIPAEWLGLEYGYKGYAWGSPARNQPKYTYMDTLFYNEDSSQLIMNGALGEYDVVMYYSYSDSGFWKVEIDYTIDPMDMDEQINQFYTIEKSLYEVYQKPSSTNQVISGPKSGVNGLGKLTYERVYLHTTWKEIPCQIELILLGAVQSPKTDLPILSGATSILRLVYFNPDYMVNTMMDADPEELPSIFDLY